MPKRVDSNQRELTAIMRNMGASVLVLSEVGKGCPDLLIGVSTCNEHGLIKRNVLVEIKDGSKIPSARKLTPAEQKFHEEWRGDIRIVTTVAEAVSLVNQLRC